MKETEQQFDEPTLEECYKFVYPCEKCKRKYGSDKKELGIHHCPDCLDEKKLT